LPWEESGGCLHFWPGGCPAQRWRELGFRLRCGTWEPLAAICPAGVGVVGERENSKRLKPRGGEYRCVAGGRTAS
jgi:hypothetical protein